MVMVCFFVCLLFVYLFLEPKLRNKLSLNQHINGRTSNQLLPLPSLGMQQPGRALAVISGEPMGPRDKDLQLL